MITIAANADVKVVSTVVVLSAAKRMWLTIISCWSPVRFGADKGFGPTDSDCIACRAILLSKAMIESFNSMSTAYGSSRITTGALSLDVYLKAQSVGVTSI